MVALQTPGAHWRCFDSYSHESNLSMISPKNLATHTVGL